MACWHITTYGAPFGGLMDQVQALRCHLADSGLDGFRFAGSGPAEVAGERAVVTAVLVQRKKDLEAAIRDWDPSDHACGCKVSRGDPLKDLKAEDAALEALEAEAAPVIDVFAAPEE